MFKRSWPLKKTQKQPLVFVFGKLAKVSGIHQWNVWKKARRSAYLHPKPNKKQKLRSPTKEKPTTHVCLVKRVLLECSHGFYRYALPRHRVQLQIGSETKVSWGTAFSLRICQELLALGLPCFFKELCSI